jgi:hypothetical protein
MKKISTNLNKEFDMEKIFQATRPDISNFYDVTKGKNFNEMKQKFFNTIINFSLNVKFN